MIYLDHAATTPMRPEVEDAMRPFYSQIFANPSNTYSPSLAARRALDSARSMIARCLNAKLPSEIVFTGCGTEADNLAVLGLARANQKRGQHVITSQIEHHAVLHAADALQRDGFSVSKVAPNSAGIVEPSQILAAIRPDTTLISIMLANNEIGTIQPLGELAQSLKGKQIYLHTDAVQAAGSIKIDVQALGVDALSISAHKFYGPKGVGALYLRTGAKPQPVNYGGGQELGLRSGTENVAGIVGMAKALQLATEDIEEFAPRMLRYRQELVEGILNSIPNSRLTGDAASRLPGSASFVFADVEGESLLVQLDRHQLYASSGSACNSSAVGTSHVLRAIGVPTGLARGSLRLTLGRLTQAEQIPQAVSIVAEAVKRLRLAGASRGRSRRANSQR